MSGGAMLCLIAFPMAFVLFFLALTAPMAMRVVVRPYATLVLRGKSGPKRRRRVARAAIDCVAREIDLQLGQRPERTDRLALRLERGLVDLVVHAEPEPRSRRVRLAYRAAGIHIGPDGVPAMEVMWLAHMLLRASEALGELDDIERIEWRRTPDDDDVMDSPTSDAMALFVRLAPLFSALGHASS